ncbi:8031_t:CDS:1, partial [Acaulospora morrowiae]
MKLAETVAASAAYAVSNVVYVIESNSPKSSALNHSSSAATNELKKYREQGVKNIFDENTEVKILHKDADPFSNLHTSIDNGSLVSVVIPLNSSKDILIPAIPHLYKISNNRCASVVIHVAVDRNPSNNIGDYTDVMALRQTGCALLHSTGTQETTDLTFIAHALSVKVGIPVIHFFDADSRDSSSERIDNPGNNKIKKLITESDVSKYREQLKTTNNPKERYLTTKGSKTNGDDSNEAVSPKNDFFESAEEVFTLFKNETGRSYKALEYIGDVESDSLIVTLGSGSAHLQRVIEREEYLQKVVALQERLKVGMLKVRLYRPWSEKYLFDILPKKIKKVAVLEQVIARTTKWTPLYLDVVAAFQNRTYWTSQVPVIVSGQYGAFDNESIDADVTALFENLSANEPRRNFVIGKEMPSSGQKVNGINGKLVSTDNIPTLEKPYFNMLGEVFSGRLFIANAISKPNVGHKETIESTPEFGFGVLLAKLQKRDKFSETVARVVKDTSITLPDPLLKALSQWLLNKNDAKKSKELGNTAIEHLGKVYKKNASLTEIYNQRDLFSKPANWLVGSDAWMYDIGGSGVHHVLSSGKDINLLIIDTQPYTTRAASDPEKRKKDIGLYAMNYGNAYVASIAVYSSYTQALHALIEAEGYEGPSIVLAYLPYHNEDDTTIKVLKETKLAIDTGYWPLYRWNPALEKEAKEPFTLDSEQIKRELQEFLDRENHLTQLTNSRPELSTTLTNSLESEVKSRQKSLAASAYEKLMNGLTGPSLLILFGSDNGNAEGLAKRLQQGAKARGVNARCMAMDEYPIEDITTEKNVVFVVCTAGQGEFPQNAREFWKVISTTTEISFSDTQFAVFGLGDSKYWPREEDVIYYNKPGKDLYNRLKLLGGNELLDLGLGDDQDDDGYETAFQAWEPELWKALGVELIGTVERKKTDDDMKTESNYLRGTIMEGLEDTSTGALCERDTKLTKFHGIYQQDDRDLREERKEQGLEKAYSFMVRVRVPAGVSTPQQWLEMDKIADTHANGSLKMTTRQAYQLHGVLKRNLKATIKAINRCLLDTLAACGDVNRNVMC